MEALLSLFLVDREGVQPCLLPQPSLFTCLQAGGQALSRAAQLEGTQGAEGTGQPWNNASYLAGPTGSLSSLFPHPHYEVELGCESSALKAVWLRKPEVLTCHFTFPGFY